MMRGSGAGGLANRAMGFTMLVEQQGTENNDRQFYFPSGHLNTRPPKFRMAASDDVFPQLSRSGVHSKAKYQPRQHHQ